MTHWKRPWCWERLKAGEGDDRGWDGWMASLTHDMSLSKLQGLVTDREAWRAVVHGVTKSRTWLSNWGDWLKYKQVYFSAKLELYRNGFILCIHKYSFVLPTSILWDLSISSHVTEIHFLCCLIFQYATIHSPYCKKCFHFFFSN